MNEIERFYEKLNKSNYDCNSYDDLISELKKISSYLYEIQDNDSLRISELERQGFAISKSFEIVGDNNKGTINGLGCQIEGVRNFEDGSTEPYYWPDVRDLTDEDFIYFEERYKSCENLYAKTEYGLLTYFGSRTSYSKHIDFKISLFKELFDLSLYYKDRLLDSLNNVDMSYLLNFDASYLFCFLDSFKKAFLIAYNNKLESELSLIIKSIAEIYNDWDAENTRIQSVMIALSRLTSTYFKSFKNKIEFEKVLIKNKQVAEVLQKNNIWAAIDLMNIEIAKKIKGDVNSFIEYKAELYLKLSEDDYNRENIGAVTHTETALRLYQQTRNQKKISEVEKRYSDIRGKFKLALIRQDFPKEQTDDILQKIRDVVSKSNPEDIVYNLIITPWIQPFENIKEEALNAASKHPFLDMLTGARLDKYGNRIANYHTEEERELFNFWNSYNYNFQYGSYVFYHFFIEAYKSGKINFNIIESYLETTWLNEPIIRTYNGENVEVFPIKLIKPGIKKIFEELEASYHNENHEFDNVIITDTLVLKIETLLRYYCEKIGIPTFKTWEKGNDKIVMEKVLDEILYDIKHTDTNFTGFDEEDRILIKFVLTEKSGLNLRNLVAHGLLDYEEYNFPDIVVILSIILKISKYDFTKMIKVYG
jgi:hypothetical protein